MNFIDKLKSKSITYFISVLGALVSLVALIMYFVYVGNGGSNIVGIYFLIIIGIAIIAFLFFYDGLFGDALAMVAPILLVLAAGLLIYTDYGNIVDLMNGIVMYGDPKLAIPEITLVVLLVVSTLLTAVACFTRRSRKTKD